jgi:uncharacterized membrane protein (UPF0127 family)
MAELRVDNLDRGQALVASGRVANTFCSRLRGLIGRKRLEPGDGLLIAPCQSVHTHFMSFSIDVLYVDESQKVVAVDHDLQPWRFGRIQRRARFVIELPAGTAASTGTQVGDRLAVHGYGPR